MFSRVDDKNSRSVMKSDCLGEGSQLRSTVVGVDGSFDNITRDEDDCGTECCH